MAHEVGEMDAATQGRLARAVRQHAQTVRLMGVGFLPVRGGGGRGPVPEIAVREGAVEATLRAGPSIVARKEPEPARATVAVPTSRAPEVERANPPSGLFGGGTPTAPTGPSFGAQRSDAKRSPKLTPTEAQARLDRLRERYESDAPHKCFITSFNNIVFGEGDPCARLMFIGEAPGAEEDKTGRPFVGRAGQLLEKMIEAMGLRREQVYIANVLKTRPPDNATPTSDEAALCAPYLYEQVAIIRPEVIVTLGLPASRTILNSVDSMSHMRGKWWEFRPPERCGLKGLYPDDEVRSIEVPVMPTYHPAFLLRSYTKENRQKVWSDLKQVMDLLGISGPSGRSSEP